MKCPKCENRTEFEIGCMVMVKFSMMDDGPMAGDEEGDRCWEQDAPCVCGECGRRGIVEDFEKAGAS